MHDQLLYQEGKRRICEKLFLFWKKAVWTSGKGRTCIHTFYQIEIPECFLNESSHLLHLRRAISSGWNRGKGITMYRIFIVEDDEIISEVLKKNLSSWGYDVSCAEDFSNIIQEFVRRDPQLVLLDLKLPFYNGFHWCEEIRRISQVPVIFISSAADNMNMVMAMSRGADDFIAKPFDMDVLTAKIQAILRRTYSFGTPGNVLEYKGIVLSPSRCTLTWNGNDIDLTKNELRILEILMEHAGKVVSRDAIMTKLWESDSFIDDNTLTVNITRLRRKLEKEGLKEFIITKKGLGYMV